MDNEVLTNDEAEKPEVINEEKETPQDPSTKQKTETQEPSAGGDNTQLEDNLPFHKHPRWQQLNTRNKELEATVNDLLAFKQTAESKLSMFNPPATQTPVPDWFKNLYGDNPQVWAQYQTYEKGMRDDIRKDALNEIKSEQEKQTQEVQKWNKWVDSQFDELEDSGKTFDRNELRKFIIDYNEQYKSLPLNDKGDIDILKCYELMVRFNPPVNNDKLVEKKKLAGKLASGSAADAKTSAAIPLEELRGKRDWRDF